jgi:predicted ATPase
MPLTELHVQGYRSLRSVRLSLGTLNVVTGPNGSGKSNLYRALWLMARIGEGDFAQSICREGGLLSAIWAGPRTNAKKPVRMTLGFQTDDFGFELSCGFPKPSSSFFDSDPEIKEENVWFGRSQKPSTTLLHRAGGMTTVRDVDGNRVEFPLTLDANESILSQLREPHRYPELYTLREEMRGWRFYHLFRTDENAPLRTPRASVTTTVLSHDGSDLAAALMTIETIGDRERLSSTIAAALPGRSLSILVNDSEPWSNSPRSMELSVGLDTEGCTRTLEARELSDGTLKFLCWVACLLSPRPPALIALNEPEASLHPDLLRPLAELIVHASSRSQIWVSTHSPVLVGAIQALSDVRPIRLRLAEGETVLEVDDSR